MIAARVAEAAKLRIQGRGDAQAQVRAPVVVVACPCIGGSRGGVAGRLGIERDLVATVMVPAARVPTPDGETARAVALLREQRQAQHVLVLGHEDCPFDGPPIGVPGTAPGWKETCDEGAVVASLANLSASPWRRAGASIEGLLLLRSGGIEVVEAAAAGGGAAPYASTPYVSTPYVAAPYASPYRASSQAPQPSLGGSAPIAQSGPVSFFGAPGAVTSMGGVAPAPSSPKWDTPAPMPLGPQSGPGGSPGAPFVAPPPSLLGSPLVAAPPPLIAMTDTPAPLPLPTVAPLPDLAPLPVVPPLAANTGAASQQAPPVEPRRTEREGRRASPPEPEFRIGLGGPQGDAPPPRAPSQPASRPAPRPAPARESDDPFDRAEAVLEKLRRRRNQ